MSRIVSNVNSKMDDDSGDELMQQLRQSYAGMGLAYDESCSCCGTPAARIVCTQCRRAYYCNAVRAVDLAFR